MHFSPAPNLHKFSSNADFAVLWCYLGQICTKFDANLVSEFKKICRNSTFYGAIWDEFGEQP